MQRWLIISRRSDQHRDVTWGTRKGASEMKKAFAVWLCLAAAFAQVETTTSITGTVADQSGSVFPGATVKLTNQSTGAARETTTNSQGVYSFQSLPAGRYTIVASAPGFKTTTVADRVVETAQPAHVDIGLELG